MESRRCAVLWTDFNIKGENEAGAELALKLSGEILVWLDRGYILGVSLKGTMSMKMKNDQMEVEGEGPVTMEVTGQP